MRTIQSHASTRPVDASIVDRASIAVVARSSGEVVETALVGIAARRQTLILAQRTLSDLVGDAVAENADARHRTRCIIDARRKVGHPRRTARTSIRVADALIVTLREGLADDRFIADAVAVLALVDSRASVSVVADSLVGR